jgi:hypothetical protein
MPCVFLGYYEGTKAYRLMYVKTKRIIKSRDVVFIEGPKQIGGVPHVEKEENVVYRLCFGYIGSSWVPLVSC